MKIKNIEFDEKSLSSFTLNKDKYNSPVATGNVIWFLNLYFEILDDFNFKVNESKIVQYDEFDFSNIEQMDAYIEYLKTKLNTIIEKNGRNINTKV